MELLPIFSKVHQKKFAVSSRKGSFKRELFIKSDRFRSACPEILTPAHKDTMTKSLCRQRNCWQSGKFRDGKNILHWVPRIRLFYPL